MMKAKAIVPISTVIVLIFVSTKACFATDNLYKGFVDPPAQAKPFMRWWWNGDCITEKEIKRELDIMAAAGVGGVEINPIAMPEQAKKTDAKALTWLSPEWNQMLNTAVNEAHKRGMIVDLIVGSGWPFGGRFLQSSETIQGLGLNKKKLTGPDVFEANIKDLIKLPPTQFRPEKATPGKIQFIVLVPDDIKHIEDCIDLKDKIKTDGSLTFNVPSGSNTLYVGTWQESFRAVMHGAPGADGPVLDHYNRQAVEKYLNRTSSMLSKVLGGKMGRKLRAIFCDSIELSGANWTSDMSQEFRKRCGYDIYPYLPFVLDKDDPKNQNEFADRIRRVRYDFSKTMAELFSERFVNPFHNWCRANGTQSRYQAYGYPWLMGMLDGYMVPDIPEGDTWLFNNWMGLDEIRYAVWDKYASSGAHLTGKSLVGCEAMTNTKGVFSATLEYIKQAGDLTFITGCNHFVLHGFNYSPPEAGLPGWVRYGTYFNEQNPWWPYFKYWADYNSRISWLLQESQPVVQIAIMGPTPDIWSRHGLDRNPYVSTPDYLHYLWQAIHNNGCSADYINSTVLSRAKFDNGKICFGPMKYELLLVASAETIDPTTAKAIHLYAKSGGKIVFIEHLPQRSPGLVNAAQNDMIVKKEISDVLALDNKRVILENKPIISKLVKWTDDLLNKLDIDRSVVTDIKDDRFFQIHHRASDRDIFFFSNQNRDKPLSVNANFAIKDKTPWRWDPETAKRTALSASASDEISIHLEPLESLLLVFEPDMPANGNAAQIETVADVNYFEIAGPWQAKFEHVNGNTFEVLLNRLSDFSKSNDIRLNSFAGTITYTKTFDTNLNDFSTIDLGKVHGVSEVTLNNKNLGVRWWGKHEYKLAGENSGRNVLKIKVTTILCNYCKSIKDNPTATLWTKNQKSQPIGLIGPVRIR